MYCTYEANETFCAHSINNTEFHSCYCVPVQVHNIYIETCFILCVCQQWIPLCISMYVNSQQGKILHIMTLNVVHMELHTVDIKIHFRREPDRENDNSVGSFLSTARTRWPTSWFWESVGTGHILYTLLISTGSTLTMYAYNIHIIE